MSYCLRVECTQSNNEKPVEVAARLNKVLERQHEFIRPPADHSTLDYVFYTEDFATKALAKANAAVRAFGWEGVRLAMAKEVVLSKEVVKKDEEIVEGYEWMS